jgi:hypothetical protein
MFLVTENVLNDKQQKCRNYDSIDQSFCNDFSHKKISMTSSRKNLNDWITNVKKELEILVTYQKQRKCFTRLHTDEVLQSLVSMLLHNQNILLISPTFSLLGLVCFKACQTAISTLGSQNPTPRNAWRARQIWLGSKQTGP